MSNFSFSHSVFKRLVQQTSKNQGLFGKGLTDSWKRPKGHSMITKANLSTSTVYAEMSQTVRAFFPFICGNHFICKKEKKNINVPPLAFNLLPDDKF